MRGILLVAVLLEGLNAHSIVPKAGEDVASVGACVARLVRRTSKSHLCLPANDARGGGHFGCVDNTTVWVAGMCSGLFQCGNGATTMCGQSVKERMECKCHVPCHLESYTVGDLRRHGHPCPPAMPSTPFPPPLPPVPPSPPPAAPLGRGSAAAHEPTVASCERFCTKAVATESDHREHWCRCAACNFTDVARPPLAEGAPCLHGHAPHAGGNGNGAPPAAPRAPPTTEVNRLLGFSLFSNTRR